MLAALSTLSKAFFAICLLRKGPQDLPKSSALLTFSLILYMVLDVVLNAQSRSATDALLISLVSLGLLTGGTTLILRQHQYLDRLQQTMTALFGTGVILSIFMFPLVFVGVQESYAGGLQQIIVLLFWAIIIWNIVVLAHIVRHALSTSVGIGIMVAILYILMSSLIFFLLFPEMMSQT